MTEYRVSGIAQKSAILKKRKKIKRNGGKTESSVFSAFGGVL